jgi:hypothetical protein
MSEINKYKLTFRENQMRIFDNQITFTIGQIKSRTISVVYFKFYGYDIHNTLLEEHTGERWVVTPNYSLKTDTWTLTANPLKLDHFKIELYLLGINSENPLYFNKVQLNEGEYKEYHKPNDVQENIVVGFNKNSYINLYDTSETFLQIIRPNHEDLTTEVLTPSKTTILAPHLPNESTFDTPTAIFYEYMYMTEQRIGVEK